MYKHSTSVCGARSIHYATPRYAISTTRGREFPDFERLFSRNSDDKFVMTS
jgi:hypothetical protein